MVNYTVESHDCFCLYDFHNSHFQTLQIQVYGKLCHNAQSKSAIALSIVDNKRFCFNDR